MEITWKLVSLCSSVLFFQLCNGFPINLENATADSHTQFLTGLVAVLLTICSIVFLAGCLCCQRRNGFKEFRDSAVVASTSTLDHGHINPVANGEFTIFTPLSPPHHNNNVFLANQQIITRSAEDYRFDDVDVSSWFDGTETDFPRIKLKYIRELGRGWFGKVVEGAAANDVNNAQCWNPVVVRILEATASSRERVVFLHDAVIYRCGPHPNILALLGRCLDTIPLLLLQEYCPQGDLKKYLRENKATSEKLLATEYPLIWCCQLTSAVKHLHDHKITHPDLATRNCQLTSNLTLKLGDYGLAVFQYPDDYYQGLTGVPVRWCAPESLTCTSTTIEPKKTTCAANVWSLGVTMWEIYECGAQPYTDLTDDEVVSQVFGSPNVRLTRPSFSVLYTDYIFRLMQLCWTSAESRPAVSQIDLMLADLLQVHKNTKETNRVSVDDFDQRWESFKPNAIVKTDNRLNESIETSDSDLVVTKELSASLNNLHGSLDNLLVQPQMESWLENVATNTQDLSYVKGLSEAMNDLDRALALENVSSSESSHPQSPTVRTKSKIAFKLGPGEESSRGPVETGQMDSLNDSMGCFQRTSSGSETEDENWRKKVERGAYTEKVRLKSRSVADLMVLTHVDCSESDTDTPLPSLDNRVNSFKNVRYPKRNFETVSLTFGSEGNLLNVEDNFEEELRKLQEERRDSLLFVPDNHSQIVKGVDSGESLLSSAAASGNVEPETNYLDNSPSKLLMQQLNSPTELKPSNQVYNVFNVTIDNFSPIHVNSVKLNELIHFNDGEQTCQNITPNSISNVETVEDDDKIENSLEDEEFVRAMVDEFVTNLIINQSTKEASVQVEDKRVVPRLYDLIQNNDALMDYIIAHYDTENNNDEEGSNASLKESPPRVAFDLSANQDESTPNSLTHSTMFASTPFGKQSLQDVSSLFDDSGKDDELLKFSSNFVPSDKSPSHNKNLNYSLETWDNFLQKTLTNQNQNEMFDSFSSEPESILFTPEKENGEELLNKTRTLNGTFVVTDEPDKTFVKNEEVKTSEEDGKDSWETGGGWFLHPQNAEEVSGEMVRQSSDSYVGFGMDDEIMVAIRNELLTKLPHAQGPSSSEKVMEDEEEWETTERNEVFLKYNVYNTPLSPIPEESYLLEESDCETPKELSDDEENNSDWSENGEEQEIATNVSVQTLESPMRAFQNRHTPSQDSCCSNDTLFNLEELTCASTDPEKDNCHTIVMRSESPANEETQTVQEQQMNHNEGRDEIISDNAVNESETLVSETKCLKFERINEFLENERLNCAAAGGMEIKVSQVDDGETTLTATATDNNQLLPFINKNVAPLPSPEDKPWKQLPASLLSFDTITSHTNGKLIKCETMENHVPDNDLLDNVDISNNKESPYVNEEANETICDDIMEVEYENTKTVQYENVNNHIGDIYNEADYVNIVNLENSKNIGEFNGEEGKNEQNVDVDFENYDEFIINNDDEDYFGVLTDIRFNGPSDNQLMSTSFSESNDLNDEQDWDSGSDTRSSSSGEFIWKEGEHEESLKALRAAPQDVLDDIKPMEDVSEENSSESSGSTDDECETPEFVPSAWDKYAIPTKSALRSPEKTMEKADKKPKGVWFKKQKYHCVYEYPREPESPILHSQDLWKPQTDFASVFGDWDFDESTYLPPPTDEHDLISNSILREPKRISNNPNLYQLTSITDLNPSNYHMDGEFYMNSSAKPFDIMGNMSSQFFPGGNSPWNMDTVTPDSGMEDVTPDSPSAVAPKHVQPLKYLAAEVVNRNSQKTVKMNDSFGGLRHTRDKLKLDLPPNSNIFATNNKMFTIETSVEPIIREKPTFSTFGKSRFLVQHVDTPPDEVKKNVSFEALPYKPIDEIRNQMNEISSIKHSQDSIRNDESAYPAIEKLILKEEEFDCDRDKTKVEFVRGEASLLDSADEDSGIESSTLERKLSSSIE